MIEVDHFKHGFNKVKGMDWGRMEAQYRTTAAPMQCFIVVVCHMCYVMCDIRCVSVRASNDATQALADGHIIAAKQDDGRILYNTQAQMFLLTQVC